MGYLYLHNNRFTGTVPSFSACKRLEILVLRGNAFTQTIPLFDKNLGILDICRNSFRGDNNFLARNMGGTHTNFRVFENCLFVRVPMSLDLGSFTLYSKRLSWADARKFC